ncbi:LLM class flavin-dependent oxidoreductase [Hyphomicrobium sp.]|uniref:LLM class flavin-dependent oxidoreductase n=1 Tax=Hyphomicrobium sp. TaxID=82 RepID=UPI002E32D0FC|nr:LLM class flavin-dependent oxidoreductase [Hyphomicrobium sp.]HEX2841354.1 LLM class flavin-dependent oxidoreductase [Hyphomicrobium sp.]
MSTETGTGPSVPHGDWAPEPSSECATPNVSRFRIGLSGCGGGLESISSSRLLDFAEKVEGWGFDGLWLNEEHFQGSIVEVEGRRCHSPLILASAILARTRKLRVGFSVLLLPLHHPVRLAEEIATLDVLSDGRVDFGISRGGNGRYLEVYGVAPESVEERFQSTLQFALQAWQDGTMTFGGNAYSIEPKPVQRPHPPVFIGTYSDEMAAWTAREGHAVICHGITSMDNQRRLVRAFKDAGGDVRRVPFGRFVYVSESDASARQELWPTVLKLTERLRGFGLFNRKGVVAERDLDPEVFYSEMVVAGSPESCAQQVIALHDELGVTYLNALSAFFGFLPLELLEKSLALMGTELRPRVERALAAGIRP